MKASAAEEKRSWIMSRVRSKDTSPEIRVRSLIHRLGYRFRLHRADLPGKPDVVFISRRKVIFVHGCFWHGHDCLRGARPPKTNVEYWRKKIAGNKQRDIKHLVELNALGWEVMTVWECDINDGRKLENALKSFLG